MKTIIGKKTNILSLLKNLPDELCSKIIEFANYEYEEGFWDGPKDQLGGIIYESSIYIEGNMNQIFDFEYWWKSFLNHPDFGNCDFEKNMIVYDSDDDDYK